MKKLFGSLRQFFIAPVFEGDTEKTLSAKLLYQIIRVIWVLPILLATIGILGRRAEVVFPAIVISISLLILMVLSRIGWVALASTFVTAMIVLVIGYADFQNAGNIQPSTLMFAIAIIMSGLLLGRRAPLVTAFLILVTHAVIVYFQLQGVIELRSAPAVGIENIVITSIMIIMIGFLFQFVISRLQSALDQSRKDEKELQIINRELEESRVSLEQRVADRTKELEAAQEIMSKRVVELQSVAEISTKTSVATNIDEMLQNLVELTKSSFNLYHAHVYLMDESMTSLVLAAGAGDIGKKMVSEGYSIQVDTERSLVARAAREKHAVIVNDVRSEPDFLPNPLLPEARAEMAVPLIIGDRVLGVVDVQSNQVNHFTQEDINIQTTLTSQVAVSIHNAALLAETKTARVASEKMFEASSRLTQSEDLQDLVKIAVESLGVQEIDRAILGAINYDAGNEIEGMTIIANWSTGTGPQPTAIGTHYTKEMLRSFSLFTSSEPLYFNDMLQDQRIDEVTFGIAKRANYRSLAALPLFIGSRQDGVFLLEGEKPHNFTQEEIRPFSALAPQISTVLENRRQFEQAKKQAERESLLNTIGQKIQAATSVEAVVQIAARELGHAVGSKQTRVILKDYGLTAPYEK